MDDAGDIAKTHDRASKMKDKQMKKNAIVFHFGKVIAVVTALFGEVCTNRHEIVRTNTNQCI